MANIPKTNYGREKNTVVSDECIICRKIQHVHWPNGWKVPLNYCGPYYVVCHQKCERKLGVRYQGDANCRRCSTTTRVYSQGFFSHELCHNKCNPGCIPRNAFFVGQNIIVLKDTPVWNDKQFVLSQCSWDGRELHYASPELKNNKEVVLKACSNRNGRAIFWASKAMREDREIMSVACSTGDPYTLSYVSQQLWNDKEFVLSIVVKCPLQFFAWEDTPKKWQNDKEVVVSACRVCGGALEYASKELQNDPEVVWLACTNNGTALRFASADLRASKKVVLAAVASKPESLRYALGGLNQDKDCLIKAGLWDDNYPGRGQLAATKAHPKSKIVLSTKFSLAAESSPHATHFTLELKKHLHVVENNCFVYSPNAFNKSTCDPNWTNKNWPCNGTIELCKKQNHLKTGLPQERECCWRYSFRWHLMEASSVGGFMIQVVDYDKKKQLESSKRYRCHSKEDLYWVHTLGDGQAIEAQMAREVGIKVFRFFEAFINYSAQIDCLIEQIKMWKENGCQDLGVCNVHEPWFNARAKFKAAVRVVMAANKFGNLIR